MDRVRHQTELLALQQAKRVIWKRLAAAADEYTEWQVFGFWLRAVVQAAGTIPVMVAQEMESRAPQLVDCILPNVEAAFNGNDPGVRIWQDVSLWAEMNVFIAPTRGGLVGRGPIFFFNVAAFDESLVILGGNRRRVARCHAQTISYLRAVAV
jgi:hypothetical protein